MSKYEMVTIRMSPEQKRILIEEAAKEGASLNQFILMRCGLQAELVKVNAMRGRRPKVKPE